MEINPKTKIVVGILVAGVVLIGGWWVWNSTGTSRDVRYCVKDSDCVTYCGFNHNKTYGRGPCINKAYWNREIKDIKVCCQCEYVDSCNTCRCVDNQCVTERTNIVGC